MRKSIPRQVRIDATLESLVCDSCGDVCEMGTRDTGHRVQLESREDGWGVVGSRVGSEGLKDLCPDCLEYALDKLADRQRRVLDSSNSFQLALGGDV